MMMGIHSVNYALPLCRDPKRIFCCINLIVSQIPDLCVFFSLVLSRFYRNIELDFAADTKILDSIMLAPKPKGLDIFAHTSLEKYFWGRSSLEKTAEEAGMPA